MTLGSHQTFAPKTKFIHKVPEIALNIYYCPRSQAILSCNYFNYSGSESLFSVAANMNNPDKCAG